VPSPARRAALRVLRDVSRGGGTLADALAAREVEALDDRERAFAHELVLGVLRRRGWLDHVLVGLVERPLDRVAPPVRDVLRLGAYQLLFLRVAEHAAVSESVDLARVGEPRAAGFVNAVLRRLQREGAPAEPDPAADPRRWLTTFGSLPAWLADRWAARLGDERAVARARALLEPPAVHFRLNPRVEDADARLAAAGVEAEPAAVPGALALVRGRLAPLAAEGLVYVQDQGSQLVGRLAATEGLVLDACAAPGGKSLLVADVGAGRVRVVAAEASRRRVRTLERLRERWGAAEVRVVAADATRPPFRAAFDSVLLDAPCTGLGTLARHPDIRWRLSAADVERHARRQAELLSALAPLVRPGARLVYATCSVEPEENDGVVGPFLAAHPDFAPEPLPGWAGAFADGPFVRMEPARDGGDAFFAASLRRIPLVVT
jgi:16S rRNA (cytosine967-C5)-methyltransferase